MVDITLICAIMMYTLKQRTFRRDINVDFAMEKSRMA
jgi:hypothetical protein